MWIIENEDKSEPLRKEYSTRKEAHKKAYRWMTVYGDTVRLYHDDKLIKTYIPIESDSYKFYRERWKKLN
jgi:hypothetical protein